MDLLNVCHSHGGAILVATKPNLSLYALTEIIALHGRSVGH